ncbi:hypothetical protein ACFSJ3_12600 [Corallincola platygyrae]|uniref:Uncharacterized protein n=1 Tax=Corallincola platygyrae TaxID=1193278 RepID=A0ABW4XSM7_9GAMM
MNALLLIPFSEIIQVCHHKEFNDQKTNNRQDQHDWQEQDTDRQQDQPG